MSTDFEKICHYTEGNQNESDTNTNQFSNIQAMLQNLKVQNLITTNEHVFEKQAFINLIFLVSEVLG